MGETKMDSGAASATTSPSDAVSTASSAKTGALNPGISEKTIAMANSQYNDFDKPLLFFLLIVTPSFCATYGFNTHALHPHLKAPICPPLNQFSDHLLVESVNPARITKLK
jgi:hypothetical protein